MLVLVLVLVQVLVLDCKQKLSLTFIEHREPFDVVVYTGQVFTKTQVDARDQRPSFHADFHLIKKKRLVGAIGGENEKQLTSL